MSAATGEQLGRRQATALLLFGWVLVVGPLWLSGAVPIDRDQLVTNLPVLHHLGLALRNGTLPGWYPYEGLGVPFMGQVVDATFHPKNLLLLLTTPVQALRWEVLGSFAFALVGAYRFARALSASRAAAVGASWAFAFGGYAFSMTDNVVFGLSHATLPWVAFAAVRTTTQAGLRAPVLLAISWALCLLGGDAQGFAVAGLLGAAAWATAPSRPAAMRLALGGALAAGLTAASLLPAVELSRLSVRALGAAGDNLGTWWALEPMRLPELLIAGWVPAELRAEAARALLGGPGTLWAKDLFFGAIALLAALHAPLRSRRVLPWALLAAALGLLALGDRGLLLPLLRRLVPLFGQFRFPEKWLSGTWVASIPLVAFGLEALRDAPTRRAALRLLVVSGALLLLGLLVGPMDLAGRLAHGDGALTEGLTQAWRSGLLSAGLFLGLAGAALFSRPGVRRELALPALLLLELARAHGSAVVAVPPELLDERSPLAIAVGATKPGALPPRVLPAGRAWQTVNSLVDPQRWVRIVEGSLRPTMSGRHGITSLGFNLPGQSMREQLLFGPAGRERPLWMGRLGFCLKADVLEPGAGTPLAVDPAERRGLFSVPCLPPVRFAATVGARDAFDAARLLREGLPEAVVPWEGSPAMALAEGTVSEPSWSDGQLGVDTESAQPGALFLALGNAPGWSAQVDGEPAPLLPSLVVGMGLEVPAGRHHIELRYATPGLELGLSVSAVGLAACLLLLLIDSRRRGAAR